MTHVRQGFNQAKNRLDRRFQGFAKNHPGLAYVSVLVCMPVGLLAGVIASTAAVMLPVAWICGWL